MTGKIHYAGEPFDGVQRCVRCHCKLSAELPGGAVSMWPAGANIYYRRDGAGVTPSKGVVYRNCGPARLGETL